METATVDGDVMQSKGSKWSRSYMDINPCENSYYTNQRVASMKQVGNFTLRLDSKKEMPVEILTDQENTIILIDCHCCEDFLLSRLPGGVLIPIASALKTFFRASKMRNLEVHVSGSVMRRTYKGLIDGERVEELTLFLQEAVSKYTRKKGN